MTVLPSSIEFIIELTKSAAAVIVDFPFRNPCCSFSKTLLDSRNETSLVFTTFSKIFEITGRSEMGR